MDQPPPMESPQPEQPQQPIAAATITSGSEQLQGRRRLRRKLILAAAAGVVLLLAVGGTTVALFQHHSSHNDTAVAVAANSKATPVKGTVHDQPAAGQTLTSPTPGTVRTAMGTTSSKPAASSTSGTSQATPPTTSTPAPAPWTNTTNCLPQNPSPYATYYIGMTTSQYLQTNSYINTTKLYAALQTAGLLNTVNSKQYTLLAMDDATWKQFTTAQLDWLNASPAHMRSLLGWQIITSCITWAGVNPVQSLAKGTKLTVQTLNGPLTYTAGTGYGGGGFNGQPVAMWDWFTSNGSVAIDGFIDTSAVQ